MKLRVQHDPVRDLARHSHVGNSRAVEVAGVVAAPFLVAGYVALTMIFVLPLLGLRWIFPYRSTPSILPWCGETRRYAGDARVLQ
jgi:hypothetical protein